MMVVFISVRLGISRKNFVWEPCKMTARFFGNIQNMLDRDCAINFLRRFAKVARFFHFVELDVRKQLLR